jgi:hypothetical protein
VAVTAIALVGLTARPCATAAGDPVLGLPTTAQANSKLGSSDAAGRLVTTDYGRAFDAAFPPVDNKALEDLVGELLRKYQNGVDPLSLRTPQDIAKLLGLPKAESKQDMIVDEAGQYSYGIDRETSRFAFAKSPQGIAPVARAIANGFREEIRDEHWKLLAAVGIDSSQILFKRTMMMLAGADNVATAQSAEPGVVGVMTYALRALDGIQVEGSHAKLVSSPSKQLIGLDLVWPGVRLHPAIKDAKCKDRALLRREILPRIKRSAGGQPATVLMAVVLRPVRVNHERVFVPALKVGVSPMNDGSDTPVTFYADLGRKGLTYDAADLLDSDDSEP